MTIAFAARLARPRWSCVALAALVVIAAGCSGGGGLSDFDRMKKQQDDAAGSLAAAGGSAEFKNYPPHGQAWSVKLSGAQVTDELLAGLKDLGRIAEMDLSKSTITDAHLDKLNELGTLFVKLDLSNTAVTDAGLAKLTNLNVLFNLNLVGTKVTPAGVENFKKARLANPKNLVKKTAVKLK